MGLPAIVSTRRVRVLKLPGRPIDGRKLRQTRRRFGSAPSSRGVGPSDRRRHQAVAAIMAPLSVQRSRRRQEDAPAGGGRDLGDRVPATGSWRRPRRRSRAPARRRRRRRRASLSTSWSTTASWNDAATSATGVLGRLAVVVHHRGLEPGEREVGLARASPGGSAPRPDRRRPRAGRSPGRPGSRGRAGAPPCRTPRPRRRRRSGPAPGTAPCASITTVIVWPPVTMSTASGGSTSGSANHAACRCASRWFTPDVGEVGGERDRLRRADPDEQRAGETGTVAGGDRVEVGEGHPRFDERVGDHRR